MSADRYEINMDELGCWARQSNEAWACVMRFTQDSDSLQERIAEKVIRQQARDIQQLRFDLDCMTSDRDSWQHAAERAGEMFPDTMGGWADLIRLRIRAEKAERRANASQGSNERLAKHADQLRADLAAAVAERDDYRDEFSGLCHTLSVGSEGRPEMTAADWRKRVDQGIDFLTRPLLSRIEATDKELAKRSSMLDICTQNCSDWIGKWRAEQERAEQAEARLAAIDGAPTVAIAVHTHTDRGPYKYLSYSELNVPRYGVELIVRPTKDRP